MSSSRDGNSRPLRAHSSGRRRQAQPEKGAPRSTTRELATHNKVKSPSHFDASSVSPGACADQLVHGGKAATHEPSGGSSASAAWPSGRAEMPIERGGSPQRQLALCCRRILLPRDIVAVPSAGRDAVAREAASTLLLRTAPAGQYSSPISTPRLERAFARSSPDQQSRSLPRSWPEWGQSKPIPGWSSDAKEPSREPLHWEG